MADSQKLVLMVQASRLQGLIWQSVLKSQQVSVIWESPDTNLTENLDQLKAAGLILPDLLLIDMRSPNFNPYAFCRWCREQYPGLKIVLTNDVQEGISLSERQWAVNQGASDLLPAFRRANLVSGVASSVKRVLEILDNHPFNNGALISVLLTMKRELDSRAHAKSSLQNGATLLKPASAKSAYSALDDPLDAMPNDTLQPCNEESSDRPVDLSRNGNQADDSSLEPETPPAIMNEPVNPVTASRKKRRYRGLFY
ncbi:MAG: hypothetical protein DCF22_11840 [Leptolyngbya sp.]|nr:MAG: hypothetical protein DCF22_11840 [Leptolyngbya sp.]